MSRVKITQEDNDRYVDGDVPRRYRRPPIPVGERPPHAKSADRAYEWRCPHCGRHWGPVYGNSNGFVKLTAGEFALVDWHGSALWDPADRLQSVTVKRPAEEAAAAT